MDLDRRRTIENVRPGAVAPEQGGPPGPPESSSHSGPLASTTAGTTGSLTTPREGSHDRGFQPAEVSIATRTRAITHRLQRGLDVVVSRIRRVPGLDIRYARPLRHYLRRAIQDRIEHEEPELPVTVDPDGFGRYRRACRQLSLSDRELIVARLELGYSYDQVALATNRSSRSTARAAVRQALLRLVEAMGRA